MAKRFAVLVAVLAAVLAAAVPAMAQETQQEAFTGVIEAIDTNPEGTSPYGLYYEEFGTGDFLRGGQDFASYEGQEVTVYGAREAIEGGAGIIDVSRVEPAESAPGEEVSVTGGVFQDDDFSDGTFYNVRDEETDEVYPLTGGPGLDLEPYLDQRATVYGAFVDEEPNGNVGTYLSVSRIEFAEGAAAGQGETTMGGTATGETTSMGETTMGEATGPAEERYEDGGTPEQIGIDVNEDGVVDEADGEFAAETSDEGVASTPEEGALPGTSGAGFLPSTGGVLPIAGLAGLLIVAGGLIVRKIAR